MKNPVGEAQKQPLSSPLSRRRLLTSMALSPISAALWSLDQLPEFPVRQLRSIDELSLEDFQGLKGTPFQLFDSDGITIGVNLAVVKPLKYQIAGILPQRRSFSLAFTTAKGQTLPQGSYTFAHRQLGYFELFIVPAQAMQYEERYIAIVNRIA